MIRAPQVSAGLLLAGAVLLGTSSVAGAAPLPPPGPLIVLTVVTSSGEPVVGVVPTAIDETAPAAPPRGCGVDGHATTDAAGHCTFVNMTAGHLYSIWIQGDPFTQSAWANPPAGTGYFSLVLKVTGKSVTPPPNTTGGGATHGRALTSSGEYVPGIGICGTAGGVYGGGVTCTTSDRQGTFVFPPGDTRMMGSLTPSGGPYVNGSTRHAAAGAPATIVVVVGPIAAQPSALPTPAASSSHPVSSPRATTQRLAATGSPSLPWIGFITGTALLVLGAGVRRRRRAQE